MNFYRALLYLFPKSFRLEYGEEMRGIFAMRRAAAAGSGQIAALWVETLADLIPNAALSHWDILRQDMRYTRRSLGRSPGFTITTIVVAALGIGATTAAFSVTDRVLIRPLPFRDPERLVKVFQAEPGYSRFEPSPAHFRDWRRMSSSFEDMGAYSTTSVNLVGGGEPMRIQGASITANLLPLLGVTPALGRVFTADEDREGAAGTVVLSQGLWKDAFGAREDAIGKPVRLDEATYIVVGVMPSDFAFPDRATRLWVPARFKATDFEDRANHYLHLVARLKPTVSLQAARADMNLVNAQLKIADPKENDVVVVSLADQVPSQARLLLTALFGASLCVLLIACTNLAGLLLARALHRRKELAVRASLGAGRERLVRQLMTESLTLSVCGGVLGIVLAAMVTPLLAQLAPVNLPLDSVAEIDLRVLGFAAFVTVFTGLSFGVLPGLRISAFGNPGGLREGARGDVSGPRGLRSVLVLAQIATSVVLLASSGLLVRALWRVQQVDPGFEAAGVMTLRTSLPTPRYAPTAVRAQFYDRVLAEVRALPGVKSAAYASFLPMAMRGGIWDVSLPGQEEGGDHKVSVRFVTPGFFKTLGIRLQKGRDVNDADTRFAPAAAVVSAGFAEKYWPQQDPLGRIFNVTFQDRIVVGVVQDVRVRGLERESEPQVYLPYQQVADGAVPFYAPKDLAIRADVEPARLLPTVRDIIRRVDPEVPISDVRSMAAIVAGETSSREAQLSVLGAFALIAILLAAVGIHGLVAFTVSNRLPEIGVRMALGAMRGHILGLVLQDGLRLAVAGLVAGLLGAYAAGQGMQALLAGLSPLDPLTFGIAAGLVVLMAIGGSLLPALRAVRVNPVSVMRSE